MKKLRGRKQPLNKFPLSWPFPLEQLVLMKEKESAKKKIGSLHILSVYSLRGERACVEGLHCLL